jgi:hypothetical protein
MVTMGQHPHATGHPAGEFAQARAPGVRGREALRLPVDAVTQNLSEGHHCGSCFLGCLTGDKRGTDTMWLVVNVQHGVVILAGVQGRALRTREQPRQERVGQEVRRPSGWRMHGAGGSSVAL